MNTLYCIKHEKMVAAHELYMPPAYHWNTIQVSNSPDPGFRYDVEFCLFDGGWATCPPPEFNMDAWMETAQPPLEEIKADFDVTTGELIHEIYTV